MGLYNMLMPCNTKLLNHIILKRCEYQNKNPNPNTSNNIKGFTNDTLKTYGYRDTDVLSYTVVLYKSNNLITIQKVEAGDAIISFGFTGCTLASFTYKGQLYAAHIPPGQVGTWDQAVGKNENGIVVVNRFIPKVQGWSEGRLKGNYPNNRCWGIIENDGKMYSLIVYENIQYEYDDKAAKYQYKLNDASSIINFTNDCCSQSRGNQFTLGRESFLQYGCRLQFSQQSVVYLGWQDGKITIMPYLTTENIISFTFSGCLFGTFLYDNVAYAVHIATSSCATSDMRNKWENFCKINRTHMTDIKIYKPNKCLVNDYLQVWGIISNTGNFYSTGIGKRKRNKNKDEDKRCFYIEQSANVFQGCQAYTNCYQLIDWQTNKNKRIFKR